MQVIVIQEKYAGAPLPENEPERLEALRLYEVIENGSEEVFDDLTRLAAEVCSAPIALLSLVEEEYVGNAAKIGEYFLGRLRELQQRYTCIGHVRGKGLMLGAELVEDRASKVPAAKLCDRVINRAFHNGLLLLSCGQSTIRFMPPLLITQGDVDEAVRILGASLDEALAG